MRAENRPLLVIFLIVFFDLVCFGIVIPFLPFFAREFGANAFIWSIIMATFSVAQLLFAPFWGSLSDRIGRRPVLLISIFLGALSMAALAFANSILTIFLCRLFAGIFSANISTATAYIADSTSEENRAKGMGIIGAGFGLGFIFGPAIGGALSPWGIHVPLLFAAGLGLANFLLACVILREPLTDLAAREKNRRRFGWATLRAAWERSNTRLPILLFFLSTFAFTQLEVSFGFFVQDRFGLDARGASYLLAWMGIIMVLVQGGLIGRLSKKFGETKLVLVGLMAMAFSLLAAAFSPAILPFTIALAVIALGNGLVNPSLSSLMSKAAPKQETGAYMGLYQSASAMARVLGPPVAGFVYVQIGMTAPLFAAVAVLGCALLFTRGQVHA